MFAVMLYVPAIQQSQRGHGLYSLRGYMALDWAGCLRVGCFCVFSTGGRHCTHDTDGQER
jgi:hypothetical protein